MSTVQSDRIQNNPKYQELVSRRDGLAWSLSALVCLMYFGFILLVAYGRDFLTQPIAEGSVIPMGMPIGVGVIFFSCVLTGIYVFRANTVFDRLNEEVIAESSK
jgi:uncharacterized membrane protein (DUF485 family)